MKLFLLTVLAFSLSAPAFASTTKVKQTYPATEEGVSTDVQNTAPAATVATTTPQKYDVVPSEQAEPLIRRLRLTETLITRYGRAYDYRSMTVPELQNILGQLDAETQKRDQSKTELRNREESVIRAQAADSKTAPSQIEASHNSIGAEAPTL